MHQSRTRPQFTELNMTAHANARRQQRGIAGGVIEAILAFGSTYRAGNGCTAYFLGEQAVRKHSTALRHVADRARNVAVVVSSDGAVVTVQHVPRPKRYWRAV